MSHQQYGRLVTVQDFLRPFNSARQPLLVSTSSLSLTQSDQRPQSWQCPTVQDVLRQFDWQGTGEELPSSPPLQLHRSPPSGQEPNPWQCQTVYQFLRHSNWKGQQQPIPLPPTDSVIDSHDTATSPSTLTPILPVESFFKLFVWQGQPRIAVVPQLTTLEAPTDHNELSLSDLSNLF
ncbi:MAG: hypothetical protein WA902_20725 [Thermosynechococcaceae cyanobacterium]